MRNVTCPARTPPDSCCQSPTTWPMVLEDAVFLLALLPAHDPAAQGVDTLDRPHAAGRVEREEYVRCLEIGSRHPAKRNA